jgi:hypothetical protein
MDGNATTYLQQLAVELATRGWTAELRGARPVLRVCNPTVPGLRDDIVCAEGTDGWAFSWAKGSSIGPVTEVGGVADRIMHVLRVASAS